MYTYMTIISRYKGTLRYIRLRRCWSE